MSGARREGARTRMLAGACCSGCCGICHISQTRRRASCTSGIAKNDLATAPASGATLFFLAMASIICQFRFKRSSVLACSLRLISPNLLT
jgi:hypothetical protein